MANVWKACLVGDVAGSERNSLVGGPFGSNLVSSDYVATGIPVIRGQNMGSGRWVTGEFAFVDENKAAQLSANVARCGDLIFTQRGTLGQVAIVPPIPFDRYIISQSQMKLTVNHDKADTLFLYYVFSSPEQQEYIRAHCIQTGVPHTNLGILRNTPLRLPPLGEQQRIANVLGGLDDKIELNRRMNETLEGMAQAIFRSWFVDFDPVRAKAEGRQPYGMDAETAALFPDSFEDSPLGKIPKEWRAGTLGEVADNPRRTVGANEVEPTTPYLGLEHMPRKSIALAEHGHAGDVVSQKFRFNAREILFGKLRPYFHKVGVAVEDGVCSTDILVIRPKLPDWFALVLECVSSDEFVAYTDAASTGTKMPRTNWADMAAYQIPTPPSPIARAVNRLVEPLVSKIRSNVMESRTLAALRDTLLPKLISGEIRP